MILTTEQLSAPAVVRLCPEALVKHVQGATVTLSHARVTLALHADGDCIYQQEFSRHDNLLRALRSLGLATS